MKAQATPRNSLELETDNPSLSTDYLALRNPHPKVLYDPDSLATHTSQQ